MRKIHKSPSGGLSEAGRRYFKKKDGSNLKKAIPEGTNSRRVSFAARFGGMAGPERDEDGEPTRLGLALKKWGFSSVAAARSFVARNRQT